MLALYSVKEHLEIYLDGTEWRTHYSIALAIDPDLETKEIVLPKQFTNTRNQIKLPLIVVKTGRTVGNLTELGDQEGRDVVSLSLFVMAIDSTQLITLGNLLRRRLNNRTIDVKNYTTSQKEKLDTAEISGVDFIDTSSPDSDRAYERFSGIVNGNLELNSSSFL